MLKPHAKVSKKIESHKFITKKTFFLCISLDLDNFLTLKNEI